MSIIEIGGTSELTRTQRWSHYVTIAMIIILFTYGFNIRNNSLQATTLFSNIEVGIDVRYPANWLLDENASDYEFRFRDMSRIGFKTAIQVDVEPVAETTNEWNVLTTRSLRRANLATYRIFEIDESFVFPDGTNATRMIYTFTDTDPNPSLESLPTVVVGVDIVVIRRGQAILLTFLADALTFDDDLPIFERFLNTLEFQ